MNNIKQLLKDDILNLENLLLKKGILLNLKSDEIVFILNVIPILKNNKTTEKKIYKKLIIKKTELENYLTNLLKNKYIKTSFKKLEDNVIFDFSPLWERLFKYYDIPDENASFEEKCRWFLDVLSFENDSIIIETFKKWTEERDFKHIVELVNKIQLSELKNISWNSFISIHDKLFEKKTKNNKNILKEIINLNWLEEE